VNDPEEILKRWKPASNLRSNRSDIHRSTLPPYKGKENPDDPERPFEAVL
jgi:hypothetical protein